MHPLLKAGIAAALLALNTPSQQGQPARQAPRGQQEHTRPQHQPRGDHGARASQTRAVPTTTVYFTPGLSAVKVAVCSVSGVLSPG